MRFIVKSGLNFRQLSIDFWIKGGKVSESQYVHIVFGISSFVKLLLLGLSKTSSKTRTISSNQSHIYYYTRKLKLLDTDGTAHL